jgi:hypothetical protein
VVGGKGFGTDRREVCTAGIREGIECRQGSSVGLKIWQNGRRTVGNHRFLPSRGCDTLLSALHKGSATPRG